MKKQLVLLASITISGLAAAQTSGITYGARAMGGMVSYDLDMGSVGGGARKYTKPVYGLGLTAAGEKFSLDAYFLYGQSSARQPDGDPEFSIYPTAVSLGYALNDRITLFGGYQDSLTIHNVMAAGQTNSPSFSPDGYFLGGTYGWWLSKDSVLTVSAAYSFLTAELHDAGPTSAEVSTKGGGYSFAVKYAAPIADSWRYGLEWRHQDYKYDDVTVPGLGVFQPREQANYFLLNVSKAF